MPGLSIIDTTRDTTAHIPALAAASVSTVIRYYNRKNSSTHPEKCLTPAEARALSAAGFSLATVFEQRAGAGQHAEDFSTAAGRTDGARARDLAERIGQPEGSAIYFAVDDDFVLPAEISAIRDYFAAAKAELAGRWRMGVYGSGKVGSMLRAAGLADLVWLSGSTGWSGTRDMLKKGGWALFQNVMEVTGPGGLPVDGNIASPEFADFGQFRLAQPAAPAARGARAPEPDVIPAPAALVSPERPPALMDVIARSGARLRRGPGKEFDDERTLPNGTHVHALATIGDWVQVDVEGDGKADGFVHASLLAPLSGGVPLTLAPGTTPYGVAQAELALDIHEVPGAGSNPRILLYHSFTTLKATDDDVAWCSSFVNYCVAQAGMTGTRSAGARSWHDDAWGQDVTADAREGDIVVFSRTGGGAAPGSGHVAFLVEDLGSHVRILGGNQSGRVKVSQYPKNGVLGPFTYRILSIRRA